MLIDTGVGVMLLIGMFFAGALVATGVFLLVWSLSKTQEGKKDDGEN